MISVIEIPRRQQTMCEAKIGIAVLSTNVMTRCYVCILLAGHGELRDDAVLIRLIFNAGPFQ